MEGCSDFLKRVHEAQREGKRANEAAEEKRRRDLERAMPAPPAMKEGDAANLVSALQQTIMEHVYSRPSSDRVVICLGNRLRFGSLDYVVPSLDQLGSDPATWWCTVCEWALRHNPTSAQQQRYTQLISDCLRCVCVALNAACAELMATVDTSNGTLTVTIPPPPSPPSE